MMNMVECINWMPSLTAHLRDISANLLERVAHSVAVEPHLQQVTGEQFRYRTAIRTDQARLDVAASGLWGGRFERTYIDVRVFNPHAPSNRATSIPSCYTKHEKEKRRSYEKRIHEIEHSSFVPAIFSTTGGMSKHAEALYKRIALLLSSKTGDPYSCLMSWLRCKLSFALLRSNVMCLRGCRNLRMQMDSPPVLAVAEACIRS